MDEKIETKTENTVSQFGTKRKRKGGMVKSILRGNGNRFYAFRNLDRLKKVRHGNFFLRFISGLSVAAIAFGLLFVALFLTGVILGFVWFIVTFGLAGLWTPPVAMIIFGAYGAAAGIGGLILSIVLRILLERLHFAAEKIELKKNPNGAEKYLKIMRASGRADLINLMRWVLLAVTIGITAIVSRDEPNQIVYIIASVSLLVIFIATKIMLGRVYNRVAEEIDAVKTERRNNAATNTQF
jgi:hypothetical protein